MSRTTQAVASRLKLNAAAVAAATSDCPQDACSRCSSWPDEAETRRDAG